MIEDIKICYYTGSKAGAKTTTAVTTFGEYIELLKNPDKEYIKKILLIRKARADKRLYNSFKRKHAIHYYPSCLFNGKGCKLENVKSATGLMVFDLQHLAPQTVAKLRKWKHAVALHESIGGGQGDYALYICAENLTVKNYRAVWESTDKLIQQTFNISADSSDNTKDITRVRFLSYDPKCYFNKRAAPVEFSSQPAISFNAQQMAAIDKLLNDEPNWHRFGVAVAVARGEAGRAVYHQFSAVNAAKYDKAATDKKYDRLLKTTVKKRGGITEATLVHMLKEMNLPLAEARKQAAAADDEDEKITIEKIVAYLNSRWVRNEINDKVLDFSTGIETNVESVWTEFQHTFHKPSISPSLIHTVLRSARVNTINPIKNFFARAAESYKSGNYVQQYIDTLPAVDKTAAALFVRYWCIQAYEQAMFNTTNRSFLILKGVTENIGKSRALGWLSPVEGYLKTGPIITDQKDTRIALAHNFIWNDDELKIFRASDINKIKALISTDVINERLPYAKSDETLKRICSFCGSTNADELLPAAEGNTRFLIVELEPNKKIKWSQYNSVDKQQFWGEVAALSKENWVSKNLPVIANLRSNVNKHQIINTSVRELILNKLRSTMEEKNRVVMRLNDILNELDPMGDYHLWQREFHVKDILAKEFGNGRVNGIVYGTNQRGLGYPCTVK